MGAIVAQLKKVMGSYPVHSEIFLPSKASSSHLVDDKVPIRVIPREVKEGIEALSSPRWLSELERVPDRA